MANVQKKSQRKVKRQFFKARTALMGGKQKAERLRIKAANLRRNAGACEHGDEEVIYQTTAEADADQSRPNIVCTDCGKPQLRVAIVVEIDDPNVLARSLRKLDAMPHVVVDLLR